MNTIGKTTTVQKQTFNRLGVRPAQQQGNVLIISLILLAIVTLFGLSAMRGTLLEQRIAINQQDQHHSMEGAQSSIAVAEQTINDVSANRPQLGDNGYWITYGGTRDAPNAGDWSEPSSYYILSDNLWGGTTDRPTYRIEEFGIPQSDLDLGTGENIESKQVRSTTYYRLSGRGVGADDRNQAIVETVILKSLQ